MSLIYDRVNQLLEYELTHVRRLVNTNRVV